MRARTFVFALVCGTATAALAQDGGYVRFPSLSPQTCAAACAGDQMCASWSFGTQARSYGQSQTRQEGGGMCTFSGSSVVRNTPGLVSGLPRRDSTAPRVPTLSSPPQQSYAPQSGRMNSPNNGGGTAWDVRPAPWLTNPGRTMQSTPPEPVRGPPQQLRPVPPIPSPTPSTGPRIDFEPRAPSPMASPRPAVAQPPAPIYVPPAPSYAPPTYTPPMQSQTRVPPPPPPSTQEMSAESMPNPPVAATTRPRPGSGVPRSRTKGPTAAAASSTLRQEAAPSNSETQVALPQRSAPVAPAPNVEPTTAPVQRPALARGTPRSSTSTAARPVPAAPTTGGAPPRQETAARPTTGPAAQRPPVRDPSNPESFRGPDGMIDAAEMRRAQLNAAREQGAPAYSVQREWEAVAAEAQRAEAAGEVRADPLAGTAPVPPPPETRAERRAREAEEAAAAAAEARANANSEAVDEPAAQPVRRAPTRGARGVPRPKTPARTSQNDATRQIAELGPTARAPTQRRGPAQALDREPRLSGGPGS